MTQDSDVIGGARGASRDDLGLIHLFSQLVAARWWILGFTVGAAALSVYYALSLPNIFRAEVTLAPAAQSGRSVSPLSGGSLKGIASLVGIDVGKSASDKTALALEVLRSRKFINSFVTKRQILVPLVATKSWSPATNQLVIDSKLYDVRTRKWSLVNRDGSVGPPTRGVVYNAFSNLLDVKTNELTGITTLAVEFQSPTLAAQWANWLVEDLNDEMRIIDSDAARASIKFLESQVVTTQVVGLQQVFFGLIEEQTKNLMLTQVQQGYVFSVIDPAVVPELKARPRRALLCIAITLGGSLLGVLFALTLGYVRANRAS